MKANRLTTEYIYQDVEVEWLAQAFVPAIIRDLPATDQQAAQTFVELLLLAPWNPALPPVMTTSTTPVAGGNDSSNSTLNADLSSPELPPADVVSIESEDSEANPSTGPTGIGWQPPRPAQGTGSLFAEGSRAQALPITHSDTDDDTSRVTAPESTAVESFKMSPPSTHQSPDGLDTKPAELEGPAWTTQLDQEDVLSSLEFANTKPMFRTAGNDIIIDQVYEIDDLELEELETL